MKYPRVVKRILDIFIHIDHARHKIKILYREYISKNIDRIYY